MKGGVARLRFRKMYVWPLAMLARGSNLFKTSQVLLSLKKRLSERCKQAEVTNAGSSQSRRHLTPLSGSEFSLVRCVLGFIDKYQ